MKAFGRLMVTAKGEDWWGDMTPEQRQRYVTTHPNSQHSESYDPKDEWWQFMTPEMRQRYVKEHPKSKYAREFGDGVPGVGVRQRETRKKQPSAPHVDVNAPSVVRPAGQKPGTTIGPGGSAPYSPRDKRAALAMTKLDRAAQSFITNGETAAGSKSRAYAGGQLRAHSGMLAKSIMHDVPDAASKLAMLRQLVSDTGVEGDAKDTVSKILSELLNSSSMQEAIAKLGPAGALLFTALQYLGPDRLWAIAHSALAGLPEGDSGMGYFKCEWVAVEPEEWRALLEKELSQLPQAEPKAEPGKEEAVTVNAALRLFDIDMPGQGGDGLVNKNAGHDSGVDALSALLTNLADYAANGEIPAEAWDAAIVETARLNEQRSTAPSTI